MALHRALSVDADGVHSDLPGATIEVDSDGSTLTISEVSAEGETTDSIRVPLLTLPPEGGNGNGGKARSFGQLAAVSRVRSAR